MKKSVAILIGVSEYDDPKLCLSACDNDVELMMKAIQFGRHFTDILRIQSSDSAILNNELAETLERFKGEEIDTLLFYFSGHGEYTDDSFRFLLKDFNSSKASSTSLSNHDLDRMCRALNPETMVKIIDACNSGAPIIKSQRHLEDNISSGGLFQNCYFFFSSHCDQASYADRALSDFTREFASIISQSQTPTIRYPQMVSALTDAFIQNSRQTPMFITQGSGLHFLGQYSEEYRIKIHELLKVHMVEKNDDVSVDGALVEESGANKPLSLFDRASQQSKKYVSEEEAIALVSLIRSQLDSFEVDSRFEKIYSTKLHFKSDSMQVPFAKSVGVWLVNNSSSGYFMIPDYYMEEYEPTVGAFDISILLNNGKKRKREVVGGFRTELCNFPFIAVCLEMNPLLENLRKYSAWLTFAISKTKITFFYAYVGYDEQCWGNFIPTEPKGYSILTRPLTDSSPPENMVNSFCSGFMDWVQQQVEGDLARQEAS